MQSSKASASVVHVGITWAKASHVTKPNIKEPEGIFCPARGIWQAC